MADLFLSHVEEDSPVVRELGDALEAHGYSTWDYKKDARPVVDHQTQTRNAIEEAAAFVLLVSPRALDQPQHVRREVMRAAQLDKPFIPLLLDVPYQEFSEREPTWEDAIAGAVATTVPPDGPAKVALAIAASLRQMGIAPSIPTATFERLDAEDEGDAGTDVALIALDRDFAVAAELAEALEAVGLSVWLSGRDLVTRGPPPRAEAGTPAGTDAATLGGEGGSPVVRLTNMVIRQALEQRADAIYFEPAEDELGIGFVVEGVLDEVMRTPMNLYPGLLSRLKIMGRLNIGDPGPQVGGASFRDGEHVARVRISTTPSAFGERAVVHFVDDAVGKANIDRASALVVLVHRGDDGSPLLPDELERIGPQEKPVLNVEMPEGVTPSIVEDLVGRLREEGIVARPGAMRVQLVLGDITEQKVDAVVNAANPTLMGGGGVDGAIHQAGGPQILAECKRIRRERFPEGLPTGQAVATTAGHLPATWVIHTVGPVYSSSEDRSALLASCHTESLRVADELGARTVAFPAISTGAFGYPVDEAAPIAVGAVRGSGARVELVRFVVFDREAYRAFEEAISAAGPPTSS